MYRKSVTNLPIHNAVLKFFFNRENSLGIIDEYVSR